MKDEGFKDKLLEMKLVLPPSVPKSIRNAIIYRSKKIQDLKRKIKVEEAILSQLNKLVTPNS